MATVLIIGASSGIGKAISERTAADGFDVLATYHRTLPGLVRERTAWHALDVLEDKPDFSFMPDRLDGLVYCPGGIHLRPFSRLTSEDFIEDYQLQVVGAVKCIQAALPALRKSGSGSVVLFSTVAVQNGFGFHSLVSASKGAIEGMARALAAELAPAIRVNVVAPSLTDTPLAAPLLVSEERRTASAQRHPLKRIGLPSDMASAARFLLGPDASWITGQVLHVDGGLSTLR